MNNFSLQREVVVAMCALAGREQIGKWRACGMAARRRCVHMPAWMQGIRHVERRWLSIEDRDDEARPCSAREPRAPAVRRGGAWRCCRCGCVLRAAD